MPTFTGNYYDGERAARHSVEVEATDAGLAIRDAAAGERAIWEWSELRLTRRDHLHETVTLRCRTHPMARLTLIDPGALEALFALAPQLRPPALLSAHNGKRVGLWAGVLAVIALVIVYVVPSLATVGAALIPLSWEEKAGGQIADRVVTLLSPLNRPAYCVGRPGREALDDLVVRLDEEVETPYRFTVRVARIPDVNAIALPGGQIVIFSGLITAARSADEVAGVLAHEMGHVVARHPTEGWVRSVGLGALFDALVGGTSGERLIGGFAETVTQLSFTRDAEAQADQIGLTMLKDAGIGTRGLADFFDRVAAMERKAGSPPAFFSTHPSSESRARLIAEQASEGQPALDRDQWRALKRICG